jgi:crotonobetainyl-CoA:carnitine CoA-transferase CaiB-like acyl-CoA transferase
MRDFKSIFSLEEDMADSLMSGFRALDLTEEKGYFCGKLLADLGVDTIKIENPGGDPGRRLPPFYHDVHEPEKSLYWFAYNTNKRGITLNLETSQGQEIFKKLVKTPDFIIESFSPGYLDKLGLGYNQLSKINPRLIMTSITPFGQSGPYTDLKASDLVVQAMGVLLRQAGEIERAPIRTSLYQAYMHACADAIEGTLIANYYRQETGEGQHVDVSIMESVLWIAGRAVPFWDCSKIEMKRSGRYWDRSGRRFPAIWECKDGYVAFLIQGSLAGDKTNKSMTEWMDSKGLAPAFMKERDWKSFDWNKSKQSDFEELSEAIGTFFKACTAQELEDGAIARGMMLNKVCNSEDTLNSQQLKARDYWVDLKHSELNDTITYPGAFAKFSLTPLEIKNRAPLIGEHNNAVYIKELGMTESQLNDLKTQGII